MTPTSARVPPKPSPAADRPAPAVKQFRLSLVRHWPLYLAVAVLVFPTLLALASEVWSTEEGAHGPIVLASGAWLFARKAVEARTVAAPAEPLAAIIPVVVGLIIYVFGRTVGVLGIEVFAVMATLVAIIHANGGTRSLRVLWFPIFYLCFLIPLPDTLVALLTQPLKLGISNLSATLLYALGYPVVNAGIVLQVAQYELLVAAACSGLNAIISLSAIGLFYIYVLHRTEWRYSATLLLAVVPIAIFANFLRVVALILITYYFGDEAAQGFLHNAAGIFTFMIALIGLFVVDHMLTPVRKWLGKPHGQ